MIEKDPDPRLELITKIKTSFESDPTALINQTQNLNQADVAMIGTVIQLYCYADFNARRIVDVLRHAATGKPRSVSRLQDAQVFPTLEGLVREHLWDGQLKDGLLHAASTVEMHRLHRHNFAHWIARRVKGADALVMFSMNAREAERRDGSFRSNPKKPSSQFSRWLGSVTKSESYRATQIILPERRLT